MVEGSDETARLRRGTTISVERAIEAALASFAAILSCFSALYSAGKVYSLILFIVCESQTCVCTRSERRFVISVDSVGLGLGISAVSDSSASASGSRGGRNITDDFSMFARKLAL